MSQSAIDSEAPRVVVALDFPQAPLALGLVEQLHPGLCRLKVGKELFLSGGPELVEHLAALGYDIFLDLKFHDIPNTVAAACRVAADLGVWMVNVHCSGGRRMMEAASESLANRINPPLLIGVTVLTSMVESELNEVGVDGPVDQQVVRLATLAADSGLDGVVCSALEARPLRQQIGDRFTLVTPGIRPQSDSSDDQRRVATPVEALRLGADYLVIGRPITRSPSPEDLLRSINQQLESQVKEG